MVLFWHQLLETSTQAGKCGGTKRDKALYAQHDAESKDLERWVLKRDKTALSCSKVDWMRVSCPMHTASPSSNNDLM